MIKKWAKRKLKQLRRYVQKRQLLLPVVASLLFVGLIGYASYMSDRRLSVNPESYAPLLSLIAKAESRDNYNAYFGNAGNTTIDFTSMTIAEVLEWQADYVAAGSPSSAVGRYQIINTTLAGLVDEFAFDTTELFDETTQDNLAYALLERRGAEAYVNNELSREEFAASLAKEWAALPRVTGDNPQQSYYAGDGLNVSLVRVDDVLRAIDPITGT